MKPHWIIAFAVGAVAVIGAVVVAATRPIAPRAEVLSSHQIGGPFTLIDQHGRAVTDRDLKGRPTVMFFGFTYCPEVCPVTLAAMTSWMKTLGPDADKLNLVYVTIDPERDTPKQLATYLTAFDPRIRGLTGTPAQIAQIAHEYDVFYQKVPLSGGGYTMDHSTTVYLLDAKGDLAGAIGYQEAQDEAVRQLRKLVRG